MHDIGAGNVLSNRAPERRRPTEPGRKTAWQGNELDTDLPCRLAINLLIAMIRREHGHVCPKTRNRLRHLNDCDGRPASSYREVLDHV
jgi:hypothetical protein